MSTRFLDKFGLEHFYKLIKDKLMSSEEKTKLENIDHGATRTPYIGCAGYDSEGEQTDVYAPEHGIIHIKIEKPLTTEYVLKPSTGGPKEGTITIGAPEATYQTAGLMSKEDKLILDSLYNASSYYAKAKATTIQSQTISAGSYIEGSIEFAGLNAFLGFIPVFIDSPDLVVVLHDLQVSSSDDEGEHMNGSAFYRIYNRSQQDVTIPSASGPRGTLVPRIIMLYI